MTADRGDHLDTIVAVALSIPRDGEKRLKWTEAKFVGGAASVWFSDDEMFRIECKSDYPHALRALWKALDRAEDLVQD